MWTWLWLSRGYLSSTASTVSLSQQQQQSGGEAPQNQTRLLALHNYLSSNPEDLSFHRGDTITLLSTGDTNLPLLNPPV